MNESINKNVRKKNGQNYTDRFILSAMVDTDKIYTTVLAPGTLLSVGQKISP